MSRDAETGGVVLADTEIIAECESGRLITRGYSPECVGGCAYEFRAGEVAYRYDYDLRTARREELTEHIILPLETMTITTIEHLGLNLKTFLLIISKGSMFSLGLVPVCTGADPGFSGPLGVTLTNLSPRPIRIQAGTKIAKGIFYRLDIQAHRGYTGQHGDATMTWPYPTQYHLDEYDQQKYAAHIRRFLPAPVAAAVEMTRMLRRVLPWIVALFGVVFAANAGMFVIVTWLKPGWGEGASAVVNLAGSFASIVGLVLGVGATLVGGRPGSRA